MADQKENTALLVAASMIAAVWLKDEPIRNVPRVQSRIADSIQLAQMIWSRIVNR